MSAIRDAHLAGFGYSSDLAPEPREDRLERELQQLRLDHERALASLERITERWVDAENRASHYSQQLDDERAAHRATLAHVVVQDWVRR